MADLYRDVVAILRANGCILARKGKGSHEIWYSPVNGRHVTVPRTTKSRAHGERCSQAGRTAQGILAMTADPVATARDLLRCPSVTPAEGGALAFIESVLEAARASRCIA